MVKGVLLVVAYMHGYSFVSVLFLTGLSNIAMLFLCFLNFFINYFFARFKCLFVCFVVSVYRSEQWRRKGALHQV